MNQGLGFGFIVSFPSYNDIFLNKRTHKTQNSRSRTGRIIYRVFLITNLTINLLLYLK